MLVVLTACAPEPAAAQGGAIDSLYRFFFVAAAVVFVVVSGLIGYSIVRFRRRPDDDGSLPPQTAHNVKLEVIWFALPTALVLVLIGVTFRTLGDVTERAERPLTIRTEAFQWGWRFDYGGGAVVVGLPEDPAEIVVPVGRPIAFELVSGDVVHAFYVPRFLNKLDVVPGRTNRLDITVTRPGSYEGYCAEFCGLLHDRMTFTVKAVPPEEFDAWLAELRGQGGDN